MPFVVTDPCIGNKDAACFDVCPVNAISPDPSGPNFADSNQVYIDPMACIDCGACEAVCPVEAIYLEEDVPDKWHASIEANRSFFIRANR